MSAVADFTADQASPAGATRKTQWSVIWLLTLTLFAALTIGGLFSPLQEAAKQELSLSDLQLGLLQGMASAIPIAIFSLPLAWMVDHGTRTRILIGLATLWSLATMGVAFAPNFATLFTVKLLAGVGGGCVFPVVISILADVCMPERRGRSMLLVSIGAWGGAGAAFAVGGSLFGYLNTHAGASLMGLTPWRQTHLLVGIGATLLTIPLWFLKEPARHEVEQVGASLNQALQAVWRRRGFLGPLLVGQLSGAMVEGAAAIWIGSVLVRQYHQTPGQFGGWVGLIILLSGIIGSVIGGFAADAAQKLKIRGAILLPAFLATFLTLPAGVYSIMPTVTGFALVLFALLLGGTVINLVTSAAIAVLIPNEERAVCLAGLKITGSVVAAGIVPPVIAVMTQAAKGPGGLGQSLAVLGVVTGVTSMIGFWLAMTNAPPAVAATTHIDIPSNEGRPA